MIFKRKELPSFMRMKYLKQMENENKLKYISFENHICGFYVLDGSMFKCLYIAPKYRKMGLATLTIQSIIDKQKITIATTKRNCGIKRIIKKLGFINTNEIVQGKQSLLEIWKSA